MHLIKSIENMNLHLLLLCLKRSKSIFDLKLKKQKKKFTNKLFYKNKENLFIFNKKWFPIEMPLILASQLLENSQSSIK